MLIEERSKLVNGRKLLVRNATEADAQTLIDYLRRVCGETKYLLKEPEEINMTLEQEIAFIKKYNEAEKNLLIMGFVDGEYAGNSSFIQFGPMRCKHRASLGIALVQEFTGMGLGRFMMETMLDKAKEAGLEQMELEVVADNERAMRLYKEMGFEIHGTMVDNMKYPDGTYVDCYWMSRKL